MAQAAEAGARSRRHEGPPFSQENTPGVSATLRVPLAILRAASPMAAQEIIPETALCVQAINTVSGEGQGDQQAGRDFVLPADTCATCQQSLLSP